MYAVYIAKIFPEKSISVFVRKEKMTYKNLNVFMRHKKNDGLS